MSSTSNETSPLSLPPLLDEFRAALQDEIDVARRTASNSAIPLRNGHKVGCQGSAYQYAFLIDSVLSTPDGAPGDLIVPGSGPAQATIVSVEGLRIVLSVESDLGQFIPAARLQTNLTILMRRLIQRIEENASEENPAAARMLGEMPVSGEPQMPQDTAELNEQQLCALGSALGRNMTVIWGPPGTGKTRTIGTIAKHLYAASRSVLLVSHTNTAVDQAIGHIAKSLPKHLEEGAVIRVGEVKDETLRNDYPDVLLKRQVERQSRELVGERVALAEQRQCFSVELSTINTTISKTEWVQRARSDIESAGVALEELEKTLRAKENATESSRRFEEARPVLRDLHVRASRALELRKELCALKEALSEEQVRLDASSKAYKRCLEKVNTQDSRTAIAERLAPLRRELSTYPPASEQQQIIVGLSNKVAQTETALQRAQDDYAEANRLLEATRTAGPVARVLKRLPSPSAQQKAAEDLYATVTALKATEAAARKAYDAAISKLARINELDGELTRYAAIGSRREEQARKTREEKRLQEIRAKREESRAALNGQQTKVSELEAQESQLSASLDGDAQDICAKVHNQLEKYRELRKTVDRLDRLVAELREKSDSQLSLLVEQLQQLNELGALPVEPRDILSAVQETHSRLGEEHNPSALPDLREKVAYLRREINYVTKRIDEIDEILGKIERQVINRASIIGATLTKTYLSDEIQGRRFDTVILDEASMAPIPALWMAALLSEANLVLVGDFKQLPPIVLSNNKLTKKWLGQDVFQVSGLKDSWERRNPPGHFVPLVEQYRMLPAIANVANFFYDGLLRNAQSPHAGQDEFQQWYRGDCSFDNPVLLVDTGPLDAWVTSVCKGGRSSRLNFLSATVAVDLAEQLVSPDRPDRSEGAPKRALIVSPYRPHAKLVSVLLRDLEEIQDEVVAGTAHSFQGSEADVVIFDLVVDEPHFRVNLFTPSFDEQLKCLLNVALTRAKFRLFILGDFDYCMSKGKKAFLGRDLLPFLTENFPRIDARRIVPEGLAARAAKTQMAMLGGEIDPDADRIVVTQADFYRLLSSDLSRAQNRIIIYSPFVTVDRVGFLMPQLQAAISRGVDVFVITKALSERPKTKLAQTKSIEAQLSRMGAIVMHKLRMHEKLVFVDGEISWSGSLNPLSFSNTQEIMERRRSRAVLEDYFRILRLDALLGIHSKPESQCPICGNEMIAAEGKDQPFYWRCKTDNCYTRSVDQPYPHDGMLTCSTCNAPVKFGYWDEKASWRCTQNKKHRQRIYKSHLRLPKMAALVPKRERKRVCKLLGMDSFTQSPSARQADLFEKEGAIGHDT